MAKTVIEGVEKLIEVAKADYQNWWKGQGDLSPVREKMVREYNESIRYVVGIKYIKVISNDSVHSFVVNTTKDRKFKQGDILMPAGWKTPARNFARGNVLEETFDRVRWTGSA